RKQARPPPGERGVPPPRRPPPPGAPAPACRPLGPPPPCYSFPSKEGALTTITLDDRYLREEGLVYLSGLQALVRLPLDQSRRDRKAGIRTGTFISGYPGSPLGGYDLALQHASPPLQQH